MKNCWNYLRFIVYAAVFVLFMRGFARTLKPWNILQIHYLNFPILLLVSRISSMRQNSKKTKKKQKPDAIQKIVELIAHLNLYRQIRESLYVTARSKKFTTPFRKSSSFMQHPSSLRGFDIWYLNLYPRTRWCDSLPKLFSRTVVRLEAFGEGLESLDLDLAPTAPAPVPTDPDRHGPRGA